ncbi:MAG TPA: glycosyltransferase [Gemmatimonadota bacterium]|jgi:GT2 family glycosyltransferase|nr:glycosyltransferase [Gemmatimonadota bacterium]
MSASLVLCTRDRPGLLAEAIASILAGHARPAELLVVDQSREPRLDLRGAAPQDCEIRHLPRKTAGLSRARNEGVREARFPLLVFTDDDVRVSPGWLDALLAALERGGGRVVATGRVVPEEIPGRNGFVPTLKRCDRRVVYEGRVGVDPLTTFNMALHRDAYERVGGFDERLGPGTRFPGGEDNEFAFRLLEAGYRIECVPDAVLHHRAWRAPEEYAALRWGYGRGQGAFLAKHASLRDRFMLRRLGGTAWRLPLRAAERFFARDAEPGRRLPRWRLAVGDLALLAGVLAGATDWLVTERRGRGT